MHPHRLNKKLSQCFEAIFLSPDKEEPNQYVLASALVDKEMKLYYFARPQEMAARAFEAIIQDQPIRNAFLVQGTKKTPEAMLGVYPKDTHRRTVQDHFLRYFVHLGQALESKSS